MENFGIFLIQVKFYMYDHLLGWAEWGKLKVCAKHASLMNSSISESEEVVNRREAVRERAFNVDQAPHLTPPG